MTLESLIPELAQRPEIQAGWVFGSHALGKDGPLSDLDVAVWLDPALSNRERLRLRGELDRPGLDLVILNEAPAPLAHQIGTEGRLLFGRPGPWREYLLRASWECCDSEPFRRASWLVFRQSLLQTEVALAPDTVLVSQLNHLRAAQRALSDLASRAREDVEGDPHLSASALYHLQMASQSMIDFCSRLAARRGLGAAQTYREAFLLLERAGSMDVGLARRMQGWAGLRNVLVHLYLDLDWDVVWSTVTEERGDLADFLVWAAGLPEML